MSRKQLIGIGLSAMSVIAFSSAPSDFVPFKQPRKWPVPHYDFASNPQTPAGFVLGRRLFFDPGLSRDNSTSCASCHSPAIGFTHGDHALSHGVEGRRGTRNSLALVNLAWNTSFHWDGGVNNLETQAINPLTNPAEMDNALPSVTTALSHSRSYRNQFFRAFGDSVITGQLVLKALAQYTVALESYNSRYDKYVRHEPGSDFGPAELSGLQLFRQHCASCHQEPLFTNFSFANNGLPPDSLLHDVGRYRITYAPADSFKFRVPTLRNIEFTGPYMHDGRFRNLRQVVQHYTSIQPSRTLAPELRTPLVLTLEEKQNLLAFLRTLTDNSFLTDKRLSYMPE